MPLVYVPAERVLFLWGDSSGSHASIGRLASAAPSARTELVVPPGRVSQVEGRALPLLDTVAALAGVPEAVASELAPSIATWCRASKLALGLVVGERVAPRALAVGDSSEARWVAALAAPDDASMFATLARSMPPAAHAVPTRSKAPVEVWSPDALLRAFLDAAVDGLVRSAQHAGTQAGSARSRTAQTSWEHRWLGALAANDPGFAPKGFAERTLVADLDAWVQPALGSRDRLRACFRLELPEGDADFFVLRFLLQAPDDPSLLVPAADAWRAKGRSLARLGRAFADPQESLLRALGLAAQLFAPIAGALTEATPEHLALDAATAWRFLGEGGPALAQAGFGVVVPGELTSAGQRRLRLRMRVGKSSRVAGAVAGTSALHLDALLDFGWEAALGDETLSARELALLAKHKAPLVRHRGAWIAVDPRELAAIQERLRAAAGRMTVRDALRAALVGETTFDGQSVSVVADGAFAELLAKMRAGADRSASVPKSLRATLRPYQERGVAWLRTMASLGLGACLADDMGLGKTLQLLAFLLARREEAPRERRPALLVAPTSVVGNWEREIERFAPSLRVVRHYGAERAKGVEALCEIPAALVVTSYGLLRRDAALLARIDWSALVLDEAQNVKNAASATWRAARSLRATHRFALTGTPVENRLAELWSILELANPGLLGPLETFRREHAIPIERYGDPAAAERLRRLVGPLLLRRLKSDPAIISDLPAKNEMKVVCTLTREQATLYQAVVDEEMRGIEASDGIQRRGRVLALLIALKQICNHPAQYLGETGPLPRRSGKLARTTEMLEEALSAGDRALVFTQFREMGDRLVAHLGASLGVEIAFLHGGAPKRARDEMVRRFQEEKQGPRIFVLSLKAGGTGLNLTAASHVFHYDRWWNPAVEDQATDRAYRIGQKRAVQVHKLLCAGTVEEKIDVVLEKKRGLAKSIVGGGEQWITEMNDRELRELFRLSHDAVVGADEPDDEGPSPGHGRRRR